MFVVAVESRIPVFQASMSNTHAFIECSEPIFACTPRYVVEIHVRFHQEYTNVVDELVEAIFPATVWAAKTEFVIRFLWLEL